MIRHETIEEVGTLLGGAGLSFVIGWLSLTYDEIIPKLVKRLAEDANGIRYLANGVVKVRRTRRIKKS